MTVRSTSKRAYREIEFEGVTAAQELELLRILSKSARRDWSLQELSERTGIGINAVSGRINGLKNRPPYHVEECEKRRCSITGRTVIPVAIAKRDLLSRVRAA